MSCGFIDFPWSICSAPSAPVLTAHPVHPGAPPPQHFYQQQPSPYYAQYQPYPPPVMQPHPDTVPPVEPVQPEAKEPEAPVQPETQAADAQPAVAPAQGEENEWLSITAYCQTGRPDSNQNLVPARLL